MLVSRAMNHFFPLPSLLCSGEGWYWEQSQCAWDPVLETPHLNNPNFVLEQNCSIPECSRGLFYNTSRWSSCSGTCKASHNDPDPIQVRELQCNERGTSQPIGRCEFENLPVLNVTQECPVHLCDTHVWASLDPYICHSEACDGTLVPANFTCVDPLLRTPVPSTLCEDFPAPEKRVRSFHGLNMIPGSFNVESYTERQSLALVLPLPETVPCTAQRFDEELVCGCETTEDCYPAEEYRQQDRAPAPVSCINATCVCHPGFGGEFCSKRLPNPLPGCMGMRDAFAQCCLGAFDATGTCCGNNSVTDFHGTCCEGEYALDACGLCGGPTVAVGMIVQLYTFFIRLYFFVLARD